MAQEGFVCVDRHFRRLKVKSPQYVNLSLLRMKDTDNMNERRMLEIVRTNESGEFLAYFPAWTPLYQKVRGKYDAIVQRLEAAYLTIKDEPDAKAFGIAAGKTGLPTGLFFAIRKSGVSVKEYLEAAPLKQLESYGYRLDPRPNE